MTFVRIKIACIGIPTSALESVFTSGVAWLPYVSSSSPAFYARALAHYRRRAFWRRDFHFAEEAETLVLFNPPAARRAELERVRFERQLPPPRMVGTLEELRREIARHEAKPS